MKQQIARDTTISFHLAIALVLLAVLYGIATRCWADNNQPFVSDKPVLVIGNRAVMTVILPRGHPTNEADNSLTIYSLRGRRVMELLPVSHDGGDPVYRWKDRISRGERFPTGLYLAAITIYDVQYGWTIRVSGGDVELGGNGEAFVLERGAPGSTGSENRNRLSGSGFLDETETRLPVMQDETARIVAADVDGDDDLDILLAEFGPSVTQNMIWINDGRGYFSDETSTRLPEIEDFSNDLDVADIDGDDDLDIVVANSLFEDSYILLNDGDGHFTQVSGSLPTYMDESWGVRFCDVTGDDRPDIIFSNALGGNRLFLNDGTGAFTDVSEDHLPSDFDDTFEICCEDVNGDFANDIIFFNWDFNYGLQNRLLINDGTGHFSDSTSILMPDISDGSFDGELIDIDGDQSRDVIVADKWLFDFLMGDSIPGTGKNLVLINHSSSRPGRFIDESAVRMPDYFDWTNGVAVGDIDGENGPDLVFANGALAEGAINRLYLNDGNGFFTDVTSSWLPLQEELSSDVVLFDADGDGDNDIVIANIPPDTALADAQNRILINQTIVGIGEVPGGPSIPTAFTLSQNYPNPFNPLTTVEVTIPEDVEGRTFLGIYSLRGRLVKVIDDRQLPPGHYRYTWDGRGDDGEELPSGVYMLRLRSGKEILTRKLSLMK